MKKTSPATRNRWIVSITCAAFIALLATFNTASWGEHANAATTAPAPTIERQKLESSDPAVADIFGSSVSIDGDTIVVGDRGDAHAGATSGAAYVYVRTGATWTFQQKLTASDAAAGDSFGEDVSISGDTIVVGAPSTDHSSDTTVGSAYVFIRSGTTWTQQQRLIAPTPGGDHEFGISVAIDGETIVVGEYLDSVLFFEAGSAYVYVRSGTTWAVQQKLVASDTAADDEFGLLVAVDGDSIIIGAADNDIGASNAGSAYVFTRSGTTWSEQQILTANDGLASDSFGTGVDIHGDTAVIGASSRDDAGGSSGAAYVFVRSGTTWTQQQRLNASDAASGDQFGYRVAVVGDTALIGAGLTNDVGSNSGSAYLFRRSGTTWSQLPKLTASDADSGDVFGRHVALSGNTAVIGAPSGDSAATNDTGAVYVFGGVPAAPSSVTASAGNARATVSWTAPDNGGAVISQCTVVASPGGATVNTTGTTVDVVGLINGTTYTFIVTATNSSGTSLDSSASNSATPVAPVTDEGEVLTDLLAPTSLNLQTSQSIGISVSPRNELGEENLDMPSIVYTWNAGSCGTLDSTTSRTPTFTASSSACSGTITVHASQGGNAQVPTTDRSISVNVAAPAPTAVPTVAPVDPTVIPEIVPVGLKAEDVAVILPSSGGTFSVPQDPDETAPPISIEIPGGALDSGTAFAVTINVVSTGDVAAPPPAATEGATSGTFRFGSTIIEIQWYDDTGDELDTFKLNRPAEICVPYIRADIDAAAGGPDGLSVWRYNGTEWIELNSTVNISDGTVCARTLNFSFFALGLSVEAPDAVDTGLPATGGYSPGLPTLILVLLAGFGLFATGVVVLRRARASYPAR